MLDYIIRRVLIAIPTLLLISFICFIVINLPAGDVITTYEQNLVGNRGWGEEEARIEGDNIRREYGLDRPIPIQYFYWLFAFLQGDFGVSLVTYDRVASEVIWTNLGYTMLIASLSLGLSWAVGLPVGIYSATRQYSVSDNVFTVMSFIGLSMPGFLLALAILVYMTFVLDLPLADRTLLARVCRRALELWQGQGPCRPYLAAGIRGRHSRHRLPHAHHARQSAR